MRRHIHQVQIEGQTLVAQALNPTAPGRPIILIHGITASINFWGADQYPIFCDYGPTYLLSLPGHYPATFPPDLLPPAITPTMIGRVLTGAIHHVVGKQPVTLVGHSTGGFSALLIAAQSPAWVKSVVSISGFAQGRWTGALGLNQRLARWGTAGALLFHTGFAASRLNRTIFRAFWRVHLANGRPLSHYEHLEPLIDQFYPDYRRLDLKAMFKYFRVMPHLDITPQLPHITASTLALCGDQDPTVPSTQARLIAAHVPQAELAVIRGGGHFLFMEKPDQYERILRDWLAKTS